MLSRFEKEGKARKSISPIKTSVHLALEVAPFLRRSLSLSYHIYSRFPLKTMMKLCIEGLNSGSSKAWNSNVDSCSRVYCTDICLFAFYASMIKITRVQYTIQCLPLPLLPDRALAIASLSRLHPKDGGTPSLLSSYQQLQIRLVKKLAHLHSF